MTTMGRPCRSRPTIAVFCLLTVVVVAIETGAANIIAEERGGGRVSGESEEERRWTALDEGRWTTLDEGRWTALDEGKVVGNDRQLTDAPMYLSDTHSKANYADGQLKTARLLDGLQSYEISIPSLVDRVGDFISYDVTHRRLLMRRRHRRKRSGPSAADIDRLETDDAEGPWLFYRVSAFGREFRLNVTRNRKLLGPSFVVEVWNEKGGVEERRLRGDGIRTDCLYTGHLVGEEETSRVAISNCDGLFGVFTTESDEFFVEPLWNDSTTVDGGGGDGDGLNSRLTPYGQQRHVIYRRTAIRDRRMDDDVHRYTCATPSAERDEEIRWERRSNELGFGSDRWTEKEKEWRGRGKRKRRRKKRSFSQENYVETLVVVDKQMVKYHGLDAIEPYVLTIMNIVAKLYRDASIGNDINIVVTRIIVLNESQKDLEITYHADKSLESFCRWQHRINRSGAGNDSSALQHDTAILITRFDICTYKNQPCGTLGLAPVAGMCDPGRSCSIIEDIGIATAFTIAHELGHNFGMQHDGTGNVCGLPDHEPARLMASQLAKNTEPFSWSSCSRNYITAFLDSGKGNCLRNPPRQLKHMVAQPLPGQRHSGDAQCKFQFGPKSTQCHQELDMCRELWCYNPSNQCVTNSIPSAEGTPCSSPKVKLGWCYHGACMKIGWRPKVVNGQWNVWSPWSGCSRSCGGGVETSERFCTNPRPQHGGKYCIGERRRYRSCNIFDCPANSTDFREVQCSKFNDELFRGKYYKWKPFTGGVGVDMKPCALNCMAVGHHFYTERAPKAVDGTRCHPNSLDMCIDGLCMSVGCDGILGSETVEDKCRVCGGDGTGCRTVIGIYDDQVDVGGESYIEAMKIPQGAMNILVTEKKLSRNYLALRSSGPSEKYFVNGAWTIDWPRQFDIAGTMFTYEREKDKSESLKALGPTSEDLTVMLLMQEENQGVLFEYSLASSKTIYTWKYGQWSQCTMTCGRGVSQLTAICVHKIHPTVAVSDENCQSVAKFHNKMKYCNEDPCPPEWSAGDWTECSKPCGGGWKTRMISCVQKVDQLLNEVTQHGNCSSKKPKARHRCNVHKCPAQWKFDEWSECRPSCGGPGTRTRNVYCVNGRGKNTNESNCDAKKKPQNLEKCHTSACPPPIWRTGAWGECSVSCGLGKQMRTVACRTYLGESSMDCDQRTMPHNIQECDAPCHGALPENPEDCRDVNDVGYCPLVLKFKFCNRPYFRQMCCKTCTAAGL